MASISREIKDEWEDYFPKARDTSVPDWVLDGKKGGSYPSYTPCHASHKPLPLCDGLEIHGSSCSNPGCKDADIYVGLDHSMRETSRRFPWEPGHEIRYLIPDMSAPTDTKTFKALIDWLEQQIRAGQKVHVGCIGGHGRTGTVLAALVGQMMKHDDPIGYVRANYCPKAVESSAQIAFLTKHYGAKASEPTKKPLAKAAAKKGLKDFEITSAPAAKKATPIKSSLCVWGKSALRLT